MANPVTIHILEQDQSIRTELFKASRQLGFHAEIYDSSPELVGYRPQSGVILIRHSPDAPVGVVARSLAEQGVWLPVVAFGIEPSVAEVVDAVRAGALDFLPLPLDLERDRERFVAVIEEASRQSDARRRLIEARGRLATLSVRERQVLDRLVKGNSNKAIARALDISPRTVEIHRANMMGKLGARHPADAVRIRLEAASDGS